MIDLTSRQTATVLAALRFYQANFNDVEQMKEEMPFHFEHEKPLDHEKIDELCKKINCGVIKNG